MSEAFDDYVATRIPGHEAAIKAKIIAGDVPTILDMETSFSALLFSSEAWADLIKQTAIGRNAFAMLLESAIFDAAEILAIKDAEQAERDAIEFDDERRIAQHEADRGMA